MMMVLMIMMITMIKMITTITMIHGWSFMKMDCDHGCLTTADIHRS